MEKLEGKMTRLDKEKVENEIDEAIEAEKEAGESTKKRWSKRDKKD